MEGVSRWGFAIPPTSWRWRKPAVSFSTKLILACDSGTFRGGRARRSLSPVLRANKGRAAGASKEWRMIMVVMCGLYRRRSAALALFHELSFTEGCSFRQLLFWASPERYRENGRKSRVRVWSHHRTLLM